MDEDVKGHMQMHMAEVAEHGRRAVGPMYESGIKHAVAVYVDVTSPRVLIVESYDRQRSDLYIDENAKLAFSTLSKMLQASGFPGGRGRARKVGRPRANTTSTVDVVKALHANVRILYGDVKVANTKCVKYTMEACMTVVTSMRDFEVKWRIAKQVELSRAR